MVLFWIKSLERTLFQLHRGLSRLGLDFKPPYIFIILTKVLGNLGWICFIHVLTPCDMVLFDVGNWIVLDHHFSWWCHKTRANLFHKRESLGQKTLGNTAWSHLSLGYMLWGCDFIASYITLRVNSHFIAYHWSLQ